MYAIDNARSSLFLLVSTGGVTTAAVVYQDMLAATQFIGPYSMLANFFHWVTTFFAILMYYLLLSAYFVRAQFNMSYWFVYIDTLCIYICIYKYMCI